MSDWTRCRIAREALPAELRSGMTVVVLGGMSYPRALIEELNARDAWPCDLEVISTDPVGFDHPPPSVPQGRLTVFFRTRQQDALQGGLRFVPMQYRRIFRWLEEEVEANLLLLQLTPPDEHGACAVGLGVDFLPAVLPRARRVVAQINPLLPRLRDAPTVAAKRVDAWIEASSPLPELVPRDSGVARRIAAHVASLVDDGDCLQNGIGAVPDAVLTALEGHRDLGCHSGLISDGIRHLIEAGALNGSKKTLDRGRVVTGFLLGTPELYRWASYTDCVSLRPVSYTHDASVLAQLDRLVAINSALEVDLFGQVNAETLDGRQISGVGGAVDFVRGAALSRGGRSIVALPSTTRHGVSRISCALGRSPASLLRTDVDAVVTEHGVAWLGGRGVAERAESLLHIAAPEHRRQLGEAWEELCRKT